MSIFQLILKHSHILQKSCSTNVILYNCWNINKNNIRKTYYTTMTINQSSLNLERNVSIHGFTVKREFDVPDFLLKCIELEHKDTGAQYTHLQRDDSNNVFAVCFRTTPFDSTGLPHILEHVVLCGSEKFPCRDPFFKMLNRSQATYMNALTGPDCTMYPFSTQNQNDFRNLMSVYLDAVLRPQLRRLDFLQEGWRLEHTVVDNPNSPVIFKGVVFNEMKGAFSDNQYLLNMKIRNNILPSHTYSVVSGGDPLQIPNSSYDNLKQFHKDYYHPSNARFYSYGNFPIQDSLEFISSEYLSNYEKVEKKYSDKSKVLLEKPWLEPRRMHIPCRLNSLLDPDKQSSISISYACCDILDIQEMFILQLISDLLIKGPNAPFYKTLISPNIASGFSPVTGFCNYTRTTYFSVGLQGLNKKNFEWFIEKFNQTVLYVIKNGFEKRHVEGLLHKTELFNKHQLSDFGLQLFHFINPTGNHGGDVETLLKFSTCIERLKKELASDSRYLQQFIEKYFVKNQHCLTMTMSPENNYESNLTLKEELLLKSMLDKLSKKQFKSIFNDGLKLKNDQEKLEDMSVLPTLTVSDISRKIETIQFQNFDKMGVKIQVFHQPTNGLSYFHGLLNANSLSDNYKQMLPVFCYIADKMGTSLNDFRELDLKVNLLTGGLNLSHHILEDLTNLHDCKEVIMVSSFCLDKNIQHMLDLWQQLFSKISLNKLDRFNTLVKLMAANYLNSISRHSHKYSTMASSSFVSPSARRKEISGGITFVKALQKMLQEPELQRNLTSIKNISSSLMKKDKLNLAMNFSAENNNIMLEQLFLFCLSLESSNIISEESLNSSIPSVTSMTTSLPSTNTSSSIRRRSQGIHHVIPMQVSSAAKSMLTVPFVHEDFAILKVLCQLLTAKYLLPTIREKGGAYGAGSRISQGGIIEFYSYKDPNPGKSLDVFDESLSWILKKGFTKRDLEEAKLGVFKRLDAPIPPGEKGLRLFMFGLTDDMLQQHRSAVRIVSEVDILKVAIKYINSDTNQGRALIGPLNTRINDRKGETWTVEV